MYIYIHMLFVLFLFGTGRRASSIRSSRAARRRNSQIVMCGSRPPSYVHGGPTQKYAQLTHKGEQQAVLRLLAQPNQTWFQPHY